jgi:putative addiction module antidote
MEQTLIKIGNSIGVVIPQQLLKQLSFQKGDKVILDNDNGKISMSPKKVIKTKISKSATTKEFRNWLKGVLKEDAEILDELSVR